MAAGARVGERVRAEGLDDVASLPDAVLNPKKKVLEKVMKLMSTDAGGMATYKSARLTTCAGACFCARLTCARIS